MEKHLKIGEVATLLVQPPVSHPAQLTSRGRSYEKPALAVDPNFLCLGPDRQSQHADCRVVRFSGEP